ncbi:MAG: SDR family NAD(P)-dependent oxidoreductase, partial [Flavitalea sp.]
MNVIITGASKGFGKALAEKFAAEKHNLYICSRNAVALYNTVDELLTRFPDVTIKANPFDLSIKEQAKEFGHWILGFGIFPDILINNAGLF